MKGTIHERTLLFFQETSKDLFKDVFKINQSVTMRQRKLQYLVLEIRILRKSLVCKIMTKYLS